MIKPIKINNSKEIQEFCKIASEFPFDVGVHEGTKIADAKSILGLMTIDYSNPVLCVTEEESFYPRIKKFLV